MQPFLYKFFHKSTNDNTEGGLIKVPSDVSLWPDSWKIVEYKNYILNKTFKLKDEEGDDFYRILKKRNSQYSSIDKNVITFEKISNILKCGYGTTLDYGGLMHRTVASGGARYPLEIYLFLFSDIKSNIDNQTLVSGIYHYDILGHRLELVKNKTYTKEEKKHFYFNHIVPDYNACIVITSVFDRNTRKYGSRGYRYILLEAGQIAQNIVIAGVNNDLCFRGSGGADDDFINNELDLNDSVEAQVFTMIF